MHPTMRFLSDSNQVPMEMRGKQEASHRRTLETIEKTDMRLGHIDKETKYINLWDYISLRNSSAEGTIIR
jgi:hypothetical protein